ncbi:MAG: aldehyde dehydrogenase family protein [Saprospiraceae bacterium]|nr:aldehyde dehydrogenase family protein [Saprospiraceae bacterium]MBK8298674.1 aldehyde dehydrogenase family protein [Saprospiraceae bacterium]
METDFHQASITSYEFRIAGLKKLEQNLLLFKDRISNAVRLDLNKSGFESDTSELLTCLLELRKAKRNLKNWMRTKSIQTPTELIGSSHFIRHEPKGVVLILAPWNYPINLSIIPLIAAWAAGNKIIIKPSELAPNSAKCVKELIEASFAPADVRVVCGNHETAEALVQLPFNHIFFTGSQKTAKKILKAASENLTSVTLELGGKNPLILDDTVSLKKCMPDIVYGKCINAGQTCIAPDFILLPNKMLAEFVSEWNTALRNMFGENLIENPDYCGILNDAHYNRLLKIVNESLDQGAQLIEPIQLNAADRKIKPILLLNTSWNHVSMQSELFGPVLPLIAYDSLEAESYNIQKMDRPLTLYIFSNDTQHQNFILDTIRSGGVTINNCLLNYCNFNLPFGGTHQSGHGSNHGYYGFETFSHKRGISKQGKLINALRFFYPPFTKSKIVLKTCLIKLIGKI